MTIHTHGVYDADTILNPLRNPMTKRINVILPVTTVAVLDKVAPKGNRSALIDRAIRHYVESQGRQNLTRRLKEEGIANSDRDLSMAAEWFPLEEETWQVVQKRKPRA